MTRAIMVVDDDSDIVKVVKNAFQRSGAKIEGFTDPLAALENFRTNAGGYSLVISDVRMPGMSGFQLVREIKKIKPEIKIILMTAYDISPSEFEKVMPSTKVDEFIKKPLVPSKIVEMAKTITTK